MSVVKKKDRGSTNEMDLLKNIILSNNILHQRVLRRLREQLALSRETIFDVVNKKTEASKKKSRTDS